MSPALRVFLRALAACGVAAAVLAFVAPVPAATSTSPSFCATLKAWAEQNYRGASPSLDEIAKFDRPHRLAIFTAVSPEVRAGLWKEQLRRGANRADLTAEQRALLNEAQTLVTTASYVKPLKDQKEMSAPLRDFTTRASAAFTSPDHRRLLSDIGAAAGAASALAPSQRSISPFGNTAQVPWCQCNSASSGWDCSGAPCNGPEVCQGFWGCGMIGEYYCHGMCNWGTS